MVCGVDEVGRGCLAGPVVACALIMPPHVFIEGVDDSKKLTHAKRLLLHDVITQQCVCWSIGMVDSVGIDHMNILQATLSAMSQAIGALDVKPDAVLVDGPYLPEISKDVYARAIKSGDSICHVIAAASILAKVYRDNLMVAASKEYPMYGFERHKGYGTKEHVQAIAEHGLCPLHRVTFKTGGPK